MARSDDENPPPPPPQSTSVQQAPHTLSTIKLPIMKKDTNRQIRVLPPKTAEEILARERERKARTTLLMSIPEDHLAKFHRMTDAKKIWEAIKSRFGGNDESKKMQKYNLKQQFKSFFVSNSEGLYKGYDMFQNLLSQLEIHGAGVSTKDANQKFLRRLGHVNFKNLNKLVKGNLVRGLPSKNFQNDHTCIAWQKGKQHKAPYKAKLVSSISQPLQLLHMDLFGPTSVRSINHKTYCLVITDDFSRFSWVFFLRNKDETSGILKDFIRQIENQLNKKVKTIRSDNGTEFKNRDMIEFYGSKGIKREYSNARTSQQNRVAERKNRTLIKAARTMLADSFLPNTFWAEAICPKEANDSTGTQESINTDDSKKDSELAEEHFVLPLWSSYTSTIKSSEAKNGDEKTKKDTGSKSHKKPVDQEEQAFLEELVRLKRQEKEVNDAAEALRKEFAQDTEDLLLHAGAARATSTNTVNTVSTPISTAIPSKVFNISESSYPNSTNYADQDDS
ncbi:putative ribonuclease H-like domain-containing protein [Tanacetum coccineum]